MAAGLPRPEPSPAGKLDEEMKRERSSESSHRFLATLALFGVLALTVPSIAPTAAWGRVVTVSTPSLGDPDIGDSSPAPGPRKAEMLSSGTISSFEGGGNPSLARTLQVVRRYWYEFYLLTVRSNSGLF